MKNCFICEKPYDKGIGICCSRQCHNKRINTRSRENDKQVLEKLQRIEDYNVNPVVCENCKNPLLWKQRHNKFCSQSCGAKVANAVRDKSVYEKSSETLRYRIDNNFYKTDRKVKYPFCKVKFGECLYCQKIYRVTKSNLKYCSSVCKGSSNIKKYRRACKFKISKQTNPELFDKVLLQQHGWYRASNHPNGYNPNGATWDHLFRIEDGYKLGVDPEIMCHPANAEMISWKENFAKKTSSITYEELLERILNYSKP
jgi:hypothetical protein